MKISIFGSNFGRRPAASALNWTLIPVFKKTRVSGGISKSKLKNFGTTQTCRQGENTR